MCYLRLQYNKLVSTQVLDYNNTDLEPGTV